MTILRPRNWFLSSHLPHPTSGGPESLEGAESPHPQPLSQIGRGAGGEGPGVRGPFRRIAIVLATALALVAAPAAQAAPTLPSALFSPFVVQQQPLGAYGPSQVEAAYDMTPLLNQGIDGTGQTIALVELDRFDPADIQQFDAANQLPDPTIQQYYVGGSPFRLENAGETTMDLEWAHALAPGATIQIYYIQNNQSSRAGWNQVAQAVTMAANNGARMISLSFGSCTVSTGYTTAKQAFAQVLQRGVSVFVSSGDSGAHPGPVRQCGNKLGVSYPASDPSVVAVGGTSLLLDTSNSIVREVAWQLSGGGKGTPLPRPAWQVTPTLHPGKYRYAPDVSFLGDPRTGVAIFVGGDWTQAGGTSLGAPAWAAIWSLVRESAAQANVTVGAAPAILYRIGNSSAYTQAFHDITSGTNGRYTAGPGWDAVTGWGTPIVTGLATAVQAIASGTAAR